MSFSQTEPETVRSAVCSIIPTAVFNRQNPIVLGVEVKEGVLRIGAPMFCVVGEKADGTGPLLLEVGKVTSIQRGHSEVVVARPSEPPVSIKIEPEPDHANIAFGQHFDANNILQSRDAQ